MSSPRKSAESQRQPRFRALGLGAVGGLPSHRPPRPRPGELFLKGPVPWTWLAHAARLPGKAVHVGLVLWLLAGLTGKAEITLGSAYLHESGVNRYAAYRALQALEVAGLVRVVRGRGRSPLVTIVLSPCLESTTSEVPNRGAETHG